MKYRYVCIYQETEGDRNQLRVEVCNDTGHKSLGPFIRRLSLDDLYADSDDGQKDMAVMLSQSGTTEQSAFVVSNSSFVHNSKVARVLQSQNLNYKQTSSGGSLKKIPHPNIPIVSLETSLGDLIGGELYLDNVNDWPSRLRVKFRYSDAHTTFFPCSSIDVFVTETGDLRRRDFYLEEKLLRDLYAVGYKSGDTFLNLSGNPSYLQNLLDTGWSFFLPKNNSARKKAVAYTSSTGITWFAAEDDSTQYVDDQLLLDSFLNNRKYAVYNGGSLALYDLTQIQKRSGESIAVMSGATQDVLALYEGDTNDSTSIEELLVRNVRATLYPYQKTGVQWLRDQRRKKAGCLLADEMGLGKTLQVLAHLACLRSGPFLVVVPVSLLNTWEREINKFTPQIRDQIKLVSYDMLRLHLENYLHCDYDTIVIDEAQIIKNRSTQKYKAIQKLRCRHKIILTGTPIENSIEDIWSHFLLLNPGMSVLYKSIIQSDGT